MERLTRIELNDYCENAGLTQLQKDILRLKYFDDRDMTVVAICIELNISKSKYHINHNKLLEQIYRYDYITKKK